MSWTYQLLRGSEDLNVKEFEPVTTSGVLLVDTTGETGIDSTAVIAKLAASDPAFGIRMKQGAETATYVGLAWVSATPDLAWGAMLVREISVVAHPDKNDIWRVTFTASGFGPVLLADESRAGSPQVSVGVVSRPRMSAAYRAAVEPPADVISADAFTTAPWQTGSDIAGTKIDINTSPVSIAIDQTIVTISWVVRWPYQDWSGAWVGAGGTATTIDLETLAANYVGGRNTLAFMGFGVGSLLMNAVDFQPLHHEFKLATMSLVYDEWHHALQMPLVNQQFGIPTTADLTTSMSHSTTVLWNQTYWQAWKIDAAAPFFNAAQYAYLTSVFV
tara:strand:+ start:746 stop:1738 length:993 start_codon:yes stop_codon:yes gene_type:complete